jgi:aspartyl-tRNA(Asn)/glutamyl-tRNA(Gln) amidotransferase subunit C
MALDLKQVRHVAALARLSLSAEEEERFVSQLSAILEAVEKLKELDTTSIEPTSHAAQLQGAMRPDEVQPSLPKEKSLANAPAKVGTSFAVPKILD